ncbi:MAG: aspartyl protease family protein [Steroidobacteraceae bacterium]
MAAALLLAGIADAQQATSPPDDELAEVVVTGRERYYVAPTNRDGIGRVWVPVRINNKGPFRMVLDSGATRSAVSFRVANALGIPTDRSPPVMLRGVTGSAVAPTIEVDSMSVGDLYVAPARLPLLADAFGGAEGLLGMDGMQDKRIFIDFRNDFINISLSRNRRAAVGFETVPFEPNNLNLLVVRARVGNLSLLAIIDTGAQSTLGNTALHDAISRQVARNRQGEDSITGATGAVQDGIGARISPISIGGIEIRDAHVTFGDMHIFETWKLNDEPALLIGMDILGLFDTLVIDNRRQEMHIKPRSGK